MSDTTTTDYNPTTGEIIEDDQPANAGALVIQDTISRLQAGRSNVYSTVVGDDFETKLQVLSAVTNAEALGDHLGQHIDLANVVVQPVELTDAVTGAKTIQPRVILLDANGSAYYAISPVVFRAVETFIGILGQPSAWPGPLGIKVTKERAKVGSFYNMQLDNPKKK